MTNNKWDFQLSGIVPPLVTPLTSSNKLDTEGLERLIEKVINGGVHGIFILGTTGEISRLSGQVKEQMIRESCKIVRGRVPVLVGVTDTAIHETFHLESIAADAGANAVVLAPPFYYHVEQDELIVYFREVADTIQLPLYLYNMPSRTHINIEIDTVLEVANHPGILGIKDSSGDLMYIQSLIYAFEGRSDFSVFVGPEEIMAQSVLQGADGGVNGGANIYPRLYVALYEAAVNEDITVVNELQHIVTHISNTLYRIGNSQPNFTKIIKEALSQMGVCTAYMEKPYIPYTDGERGEIKECIEELPIPELYLI